MIQRSYIELKRKGQWVLYRVGYYYKNKSCWYYELHKETHRTKSDDVICFGQKRFDDLKKMMNALSEEIVDLSHVSVVDKEKIIIDPNIN